MRWAAVLYIYGLYLSSLTANLSFASTPAEKRLFDQAVSCTAKLIEAAFDASELEASPSDSRWYFSKDLGFLENAVFDRESWPQINVRTLEPSQWLAVDTEPETAFQDLLLRRRDILQSVEREHVVLSLPDPEIRAAGLALLRKKAAYLSEHFPQHYTVHKNWIHNALTQEAFDLEAPSQEPLEIFARLTTNDVLLARIEETDLRFVAGAVLFTASWDPGSLLGQPLRAIHDLDGADEKFHGGVGKVMSRLSKDPGLTLIRNNWFWRTDPTLFQHLERDWIFPYLEEDMEPVTALNIADRLYLRMERETFSAVPGYPNYIAFTLDSKVYPLRAVAAIPAIAEKVLRGLQKNPGGTVLSEHTDLLEAYLTQSLLPAPP